MYTGEYVLRRCCREKEPFHVVRETQAERPLQTSSFLICSGLNHCKSYVYATSPSCPADTSSDESEGIHRSVSIFRACLLAVMRDVYRKHALPTCHRSSNVFCLYHAVRLPAERDMLSRNKDSGWRNSTSKSCFLSSSECLHR